MSKEADDKIRVLKATWSFTSTKDLLEEINGDVEISDPAYDELSDEEKVWDRLKHGVRTKTLGDLLQDQLAAELRNEIDKEMIEAITKVAKDGKY